MVWLAAVIALLAAADFGARAYAENLAAAQIRKHGFPGKPHVSIGGFPFLTQAISHHFSQVTVTSANVPAGPVTITRLRVVADDVRLNSRYDGGTAGPVRGTVFISLGELGKALSAAGPLASLVGGQGNLKVRSVHGDEARATLTLAGGALSWSATWKITAPRPREIDLRLVAGSGLPQAVRSGLASIRLPLSALPAGLRLTGGLSSSSTGITANVYATSLHFGS